MTVTESDGRRVGDRRRSGYPALFRGALLAGLALLFVGIPAASAGASGFAADDYPAVMAGDSEGFYHALTIGGGTFTCEPSLIEAELLEPSETASAEAETYCNGNPLEMNGCELILDPGPETSPGDFAGVMDIGPPGCGPITLNYWYDCSASIPPQTGLNATYENRGEGASASVDVTIYTDELVHELSGKVQACPQGPRSNGGYEAKWELEGWAAGGEPNGVRVEPSDHSPRVDAAAYPATVEGSQGAEPEWQMAGGSISCEGSGLESELSAASAKLDFAAQYSGCTAYGLPAAIDMHSCGYELDVLDAGPPYAGQLGIACAEAEEQIEINIWATKSAKEQEKAPICIVEIPPQEGLQGVALDNLGGGGTEAVGAEFGVEGVSYALVRKSFICPNPGGNPYEAEDGVFSAEATFEAFDGEEQVDLRITGEG